MKSLDMKKILFTNLLCVLLVGIPHEGRAVSDLHKKALEMIEYRLPEQEFDIIRNQYVSKMFNQK